jgi:hypothetical protein
MSVKLSFWKLIKYSPMGCQTGPNTRWSSALKIEELDDNFGQTWEEQDDQQSRKWVSKKKESLASSFPLFVCRRKGEENQAGGMMMMKDCYWHFQTCDLHFTTHVHIFPNFLSLHIVKDVGKFFSSIHPSRHPSMDGIIQGRKPWQK